MSRLRVRLAHPTDADSYVETLVVTQIATYAAIMPQEYARDRRAEAPAMTTALAEELHAREARLAAGGEPSRRHWGDELLRWHWGDEPLRWHWGDEPLRWHWVAELDESIVGIACAGSGPSWWEADFDPPPPGIPWILDRLYVLPQAHGSGAGQALFDVAVGARSAYLWILRNNSRAERFYRRNGFVPDGSVGNAGGSWFDRPMFRLVRRAS